MARSVTVNADNVTLPDGGTYNTGDTVTLTDEQFQEIAATALGDEVTDNGEVGGVSAVAAIANPATATATDVANKVNEMLAALKA